MLRNRKTNRNNLLKEKAPIPKIKSVRMEPAEFTNEFTIFYCIIIPKIYDIVCPTFLDDVKVALKKIRKLIYEIETSNSEDLTEEYSYEKAGDRCAYIYAYSVINSGSVYSQFLKHFRQNESTFLELFDVKNLVICCLGGGPGIEAVALIKLIHDKIWRFSKDNPNSLINVHVTVVDICAEWMSEASAIINALNDSPEFINARKVRFHFNFLKVDLLDPFEQLLEDEIKKANIITIVKLMGDKRMSYIPKFQRMLDVS